MKQAQIIKEYRARKKALLGDEWLREKIGEVKAVSQFWNDTQEGRRLWNKINARMNKMKQIGEVAEKKWCSVEKHKAKQWRQ